MDPIEGLGGVRTPGLNLNQDEKSQNPSDVNFGEILDDALNRVDQLQKESEAMNAQLAMGEVDNLHDVVIAAERAELALNLTLEVRNRLVEAYQETMQMQI